MSCKRVVATVLLAIAACAQTPNNGASVSVLHFVAPAYPVVACIALVQGTAVAEVNIKADGAVDSVKVISFRLLSGSEEEIEIGEHGIRIRRESFGWNRVSEYPLERCSDLDLQTNKEDSRQLQFRLGKWRTIEFGRYMSKERAERVLETLADSLPEIGRKLLPSMDITNQWTTLNLK